VIDGPFPESKQLVAGYWILQVQSMDEAVEWAERFPFEALSRIYPGEYGAEGELELRQVFEPEEWARDRGSTRWVTYANALTSRQLEARETLSPQPLGNAHIDCGAMPLRAHRQRLPRRRCGPGQSSTATWPS
jgi:hypothetical protein